MPAPKTLINGFTPQEVHEITGITLHMLDYLCRHGYLRPTYAKGKRIRGKVRYFSYRDLVITAVVQNLRNAGVRLGRLKTAIQYLGHDHAWFASGRRSTKPIQWLVSDGKNVLLKHEDGFLDELRPGGQRAFAFVVSLGGVQSDVRQLIGPKKRQHFSLQNLPLRYEATRRTGAK
jgi:DNA-binding transcriptional MerR regulator